MSTLSQSKKLREIVKTLEMHNSVSWVGGIAEDKCEALQQRVNGSLILTVAYSSTYLDGPMSGNHVDDVLISGLRDATG